MNFIWPESARSELRAVDRDSAMRILLALTRYGESGEGDVKALSSRYVEQYTYRRQDRNE
jgi:hypothetical protein